MPTKSPMMHEDHQIHGIFFILIWLVCFFIVTPPIFQFLRLFALLPHSHYLLFLGCSFSFDHPQCWQSLASSHTIYFHWLVTPTSITSKVTYEVKTPKLSSLAQIYVAPDPNYLTSYKAASLGFSTGTQPIPQRTILFAISLLFPFQ